MTAEKWMQQYSSEEFKQKYGYDGEDLGVVCTEMGTEFKLWSPLSKKVQLNLYKEGESGDAYANIPMEEEENGVWHISLSKSLHGIYYDYDIRVNGQQNLSADPYAKACGRNGNRSMAVDLKRTNPPGWEKDQAPQITAEQIIYEVHVKEFSWDESAGFPKEHRGTYKAFTDADTTLHGDGIHPTGIAYLKRLGITHVQLMPVYDYGSVDEAGDASEFNWGYDPVNYNVPEGSYATDCIHGDVRIRELKELVCSLHQNGFRVIMDVVYNHTYHTDSWFQRTVPWYYYRQNQDGSFSNGSGCGNDVASEREMCGKYIRDSVLYWAEEYHMDGFRFDLMGLLNVELVNEIQNELDRRYGPGEKLLYGEPWAAGQSPMEAGFLPALKANISQLHKEVGIFCDNTRDAIKGHIFEGGEPGFVNGGSEQEALILQSVDAWCSLGGELKAKAPSQIITYVSSHDNLTLWDKLVLTLYPEGDFHEMYSSVVRAYKLAAAIYFTCQGRLFLLSGEEFARTKEGIEDSFDSPIEINRMDWNRAYENEEILSYYKGLIALRKELPGLYDKSDQAFKRITQKKKDRDGVVSFCMDNRSEMKECRWEQLFIAYNSRGDQVILKLPSGIWEVLADENSSRLWEQPETVRDDIRLSPVSAVVLGRKQ